MPLPDPRTAAYDDDLHLAEDALRGQLPTPADGKPWRYVTPHPVWAGAARLSLREGPDARFGQVTEALPGEALELLWANADGWSRVRTAQDRYLGWVPSGSLVPHAPQGEALMVTALRGHAFAGPKVSETILAELCLGARLVRAGAAVTERGRRWQPVFLPGNREGWVQAVTLSPLPDADSAALALRFLDTPYVWGGRSAWGLDCSGLTQGVFAAFGMRLPRDADQQQAALKAVDAPQRGDLAFFPGHVGLMLGNGHMVHANATNMKVSIETLGEGDYGQRLAATCTGYGRWTA